MSEHQRYGPSSAWTKTMSEREVQEFYNKNIKPMLDDEQHDPYTCDKEPCPNCCDGSDPERCVLQEHKHGLKTLLDAAKKPACPVMTGYQDIDNFLWDTLEVMRKKGHDYRQGNDDDLLHNFRSVAEQVGTSPEKVWFTYFYKHYAALSTFIKNGGQSESEPIEGRITDMIVYLLLFHQMVQEKKTRTQPTTISGSPPMAWPSDNDHQ